MSGDVTKRAVAVYIEREKAAMKTPQGADHDAIIEQVAAEFGISSRTLADAVLDATAARAI